MKRLGVWTGMPKMRRVARPVVIPVMRRVSPVQKRAVVVTETDDRITIVTNEKIASAVLMVLSGATYKEAAEVVGVTRERVHQYFKKTGLSVRSRVRFKNGQHGRLPRDMRLERAQRFDERRETVVAGIRLFVEMHRRPPTYGELAAMFGKCWDNGAAPTLVKYIGPTYATDTRELRRLYDRAGFRAWRRGQQATPRDHDGVVKKMHAGWRRWWRGLSARQKAAKMASLSRARYKD